MSGGFRVGIVKAQDVQNGRVRVTFLDRDQMQSWWLRLVMPKTQNDKAYWVPDVGEQVICLMDEHDEDGAVLGAIYSQADGTPVQSADKWHVTFKDATSFEYDRAAHVLDLKFKDGTEIEYDAGGHLLDLKFEDGGEVKYDAAAHAFSVAMPNGGTITLSANGATIAIDPSGNVKIVAAGNVTITPGAGGQVLLG